MWPSSSHPDIGCGLSSVASGVADYPETRATGANVRPGKAVHDPTECESCLTLSANLETPGLPGGLRDYPPYGFTINSYKTETLSWAGILPGRHPWEQLLCPSLKFLPLQRVWV